MNFDRYETISGVEKTRLEVDEDCTVSAFRRHSICRSPAPPLSSSRLNSSIVVMTGPVGAYPSPHLPISHWPPFAAYFRLRVSVQKRSLSNSSKERRGKSKRLTFKLQVSGRDVVYHCVPSDVVTRVRRGSESRYGPPNDNSEFDFEVKLRCDNVPIVKAFVASTVCYLAGAAWTVERDSIPGPNDATSEFGEDQWHIGDRGVLLRAVVDVVHTDTVEVADFGIRKLVNCLEVRSHPHLPDELSATLAVDRGQDPPHLRTEGDVL